MTQRLTIALTGGTGFIGRHVARHLHRQGHHVRLLLRAPAPHGDDADSVVIGDIVNPVNMGKALEGADAVIHSAGIAHVQSGRPDEDYRRVNTDATVNLARQAKRAGVKQFVFLSSIRAQSGPWAEHVLTEEDTPQPTGAYGQSKFEAETRLAEIDIGWTALRPVVVYGEGAVGNIAALLNLAASPWPLPLGGLKARRSLVSAQSVATAIAHVLHTPSALRHPWIVADSEALTAGEIISALRSGMNRKPGIFYAPAPCLTLAAAMLGQSENMSRLSRPLVASSSALQAQGWKPAIATHDGLKELGRQFISGPSRQP